MEIINFIIAGFFLLIVFISFLIYPNCFKKNKDSLNICKTIEQNADTASRDYSSGFIFKADSYVVGVSATSTITTQLPENYN